MMKHCSKHKVYLSAVGSTSDSKDVIGTDDCPECLIERLQTENAELSKRLSVTLEALNKASQIAWHPEGQYDPMLPNADRWKIVNLYRDVVASFRH